VTELSGSLEGIGLLAVVRFLASVAPTGRLALVDGSLQGWLDLDAGALVGATFDQEQGLPALEAIALALGTGRFEFHDTAPPPEHSLRLAPAEIDERLEQLAQEQRVLAAAIPSLSGVPSVILDEAAEAQNGQVALERDTLRLLLRLDGRRTVAQLARERGLLRTLRQLAQLVQLGLARIDLPSTAAVAAAPQPAPEPAPAAAAAEPPARAQPSSLSASSAARARPPSGETTWSRWRRPNNNQS